MNSDLGAAFDGCFLDLRHHVLFRDVQVVSLPPKSLQLLAALVRNAGQVVTKHDIMLGTRREALVPSAINEPSEQVSQVEASRVNAT